MAKIIATAENYAFGPASKLVTVCKRLIDEGHEVTFIGEGTAYQLASKLNFKKLYKFNTDSKEFMNWGIKIFKDADVLLSSIDRSSVILAKKINLPVIWLDMLFWWWDNLPEYLFDVDLYIQQNSVKNELNMKRYKNQIKNMKIVGPIIDNSYKNLPAKKQLLVAFGGTEAAGWYKIGKDSNYPYTISKIIIEKVDTSKYDKVIFAGNEKIMADLNKKYGNTKFNFKILSHDDWLKEIASSQDLLVHPGLETVLEIISYEKPAFFLPPDNSSAYVELDEFIRKGVATKENSIHFADYFPHRNFLGRDLKVIMEEFMKEMRKFEASKEILNDCAKRINFFINMPQKRKNAQILRQRKYMDDFGKNGLEKTIQIIDAFLTKKIKHV
jgi:UDP-N-acetylglucosamine:LPS N-acetylglucosamine transferase